MRVIICDDEHLARERLLRLLNHLGHQVVAQASTGRQALLLVAEFQPDVIILDIRMPELDGMSCAEELSKMPTPPAIIFCTAYDEYAISAFRTQAISYLLKPVSVDDLAGAMQKATKLNQAQLHVLPKNESEQAVAEPQEQNLTRQHITARHHRGVELIAIDDIYYLLADQKYVLLRHKKGQVLIDETLKDLEQEFADKFFRVHRNALINKNYIEALDLIDGNYHVRIKETGDHILISRRHLPQVRAMLHQL
ncbi:MULTISPECIES: LytR/AlgR family response regulator transcription factor [unclassified Acinetobacter]|uniref:LytR/AlgR family response regulator transcription factor n=1 Tax=unclassified Acinetobacter TaxID=196816 RepID=UPI0035B7F94B